MRGGPTGEGAVSRKEAIWLACKAKTCCSTQIVVPTGRDVWRIARTLDAPPWSFLVYFPSPQPRPDAFALDHSDATYRLALARRPSTRKNGTPACTFLLRTRDGHHRCGLGRLRPMVCQTFPSQIVAGVVCLPDDTPCACRAWTLADVDIAEERALVEASQADLEEYRGVVAHWNDRLADAPVEARFTFFDFCLYVVKAYDELAARSAAEAARP